MKRAAIYIRVSSERQAEGVSPEAQEADCRALCEQKRYEVVAVYRDTEKYRIGKRMVEPSGTRADRPGLKAMLAAAREDRFDVIVAWKEDRLYRSYRPMLDVLDVLDDTNVDIELAKETFDKRIAPVKAWAARMELDAKHDRFMMGVAGRLENGKPWFVNAPYGYQVVNDKVVINEAEAVWVREIWKAFADGESVYHLRRRLVNLGAQQRRADVTRKWAKPYIYRLLNYQFYSTGVFGNEWNGKRYEIQVPPIIDAETAQRVAERHSRFHHYPAGNLRANSLAAGLLYCQACNRKLIVHTSTSRGKKYNYYRCTLAHESQFDYPDCCRNMKMESLDGNLWERVWEVIGVPGRLESAIHGRVAQIHIEEVDAEKELARLGRNLDDLNLERQRVITLARKGIINDDDVAQQLLGLDIQTKQIHNDIANTKLLTGDRSARLLELAATFRQQIQVGMDAYNRVPQSEEEAQLQFVARRQIVEAIVSRVEVSKDKALRVGFTLDFARDLFADQSQSIYQLDTDTQTVFLFEFTV